MAAGSSFNKLLVAGGQNVVSHNDLWQVGKGGRNQLSWQYFQAWRMLTWIGFFKLLMEACFCGRMKKKRLLQPQLLWSHSYDFFLRNSKFISYNSTNLKFWEKVRFARYKLEFCLSWNSDFTAHTSELLSESTFYSLNFKFTFHSCCFFPTTNNIQIK